MSFQMFLEVHFNWNIGFSLDVLILITVKSLIQLFSFVIFVH